jgi:TRAP-type C4-dicarboxylate transport system substrate-binding protein
MCAWPAVRCAVIGAALLLCAMAVSPAQAATTWKAQVWGPKRASLIPFEWYAQEVANRTGGQMKIDIAYDKGKVTDSVPLLQSGGADVTFVCTQFFAEKMRLLTIFDLPLLSPNSLGAVGRVELALADHPAVVGELRKSNLMMLLPTPLPQYQLMGTRRLAGIDDLQGARVRISPDQGRQARPRGVAVSLCVRHLQGGRSLEVRHRHDLVGVAPLLHGREPEIVGSAPAQREEGDARVARARRRAL